MSVYNKKYIYLMVGMIWINKNEYNIINYWVLNSHD